MDVKAKINEIVTKVKSDPKLMESFTKDPVKTVEGIIGVDIPDGVADQIVSGVKGALASDKISGAVNAVKNLF